MVFQPRFMATLLPSVPHRDAEQICQLVLDHFPEAPCLPSLTRSTRMFLEGMPCLVVDAENRKLSFDLSGAREGELVAFYERVLADDLDYFAISEQWAPGVYAMLRALQQRPPADLRVVHFLVPGPVTFALVTTDQNGVPAFYNEVLRDILVKHLSMKARWQERLVQQALPGVSTMVSFGEPALVIHTSAVGSGPREDLVKAMDEILGSVQGVAGIHCCANVDWSMLLETKASFINFDSFEYIDRLALYADDLKRFLARGGMLSLGCVPVSDDKLAAESVEGLVIRLEQGLQLMVDKGIDRELLAASSWITPSCEVALMSPAMAERAFAYTSAVSRRLREQYFSSSQVSAGGCAPLLWC